MISFVSLPSPLRWCLGNAPSVKETLNGHSWWSMWLAVKAVDSMLRGIAQVCFADNPLSGLLILIGLFIGDVTAGIGAVICSLAAIATALIFQQPDEAITSGLTNFSAVLVGSVTASLYPLFFHQPLVPAVWGYMLVAAVFSVCIGSGLGAILSTFKLPCFTLPFNIATCITFICMRAAGVVGVPAETSVGEVEVEDIHWPQVFLGTLLSAGQVYAVESVVGSCLIIVGLLVCSPLLTVVSMAGALVACLTALVVSSPPYSLLYSGVWGYNGFLSAGCLVFFVVPGPRLYALALVNAVFTTFLQAGIAPVFALNQLPVFTFPFCTSSLLFLAMASAGAVGTPRVPSPTFPENHIMSYLKSKKNGQENDSV